jgi:phenylacetate-coenzyme A ligase PaaK-like adenylate-forming protein
MSKVVGRADDMIVVRGVNVYPSEVERVLLGSGLVRPHYQLVVDRRSPAVRLLVACEALSGDPRERLVHELHEALGLTAEVFTLPDGAVPRVEVGKAVRVLSWDDGRPPLPGLG